MRQQPEQKVLSEFILQTEMHGDSMLLKEQPPGFNVCQARTLDVRASISRGRKQSRPFDFSKGLDLNGSGCRRHVRHLEEVSLHNTDIPSAESRRILRINSGWVTGCVHLPSLDKLLNFYRRAWNRILKRTDIEPFPPNGLRHNYASTLVAAGVPLETVGHLLGHKNTVTTRKYAHHRPDQLHRAADTFTDVIDFKTEKKKRGG